MTSAQILEFIRTQYNDGPLQVFPTKKEAEQVNPSKSHIKAKISKKEQKELIKQKILNKNKNKIAKFDRNNEEFTYSGFYDLMTSDDKPKQKDILEYLKGLETEI